MNTHNCDHMDENTRESILASQKAEITEHHIYGRLSRSAKNPHNRKVLKRISDDELKHSNIWEKHTGVKVEPRRLTIWKYILISKIFGITFAIKLMEGGEKNAQINYDKLSKFVPKAKRIEKEENAHETELIEMIDEERLKYVGSIVLGLNDALVELTGALAGFTFALQRAGVIAMVGLITGIAAAMSMAASEYLSTKTEGGSKKPLKASAYTGSAYVLTVMFLILPFFILSNVYLSLGLTVLNAIIIILIFTFYISVVNELPFKKRFAEMAVVSLGVAALSFLIGVLIKTTLGVDI